MSASETSKEDRQLPATERRLQQAREEGQLARSRDLVHLAAVMALLALFVGLGPWLAQQALQLVSAGLRFDRTQAFESASLLPRLSGLGMAGLATVVPIAGALALLMAATTLAVGGWNFTLKALEPKFDRLDPFAALARMFAWRQMLSHLRLIALASALLGCAWLYLSNHASELDLLARLPLAAALHTGFGWVVSGLTLMAGVCAASALADVPMQIFKHKSELKMSLEETKQENKESEGDPHVKGMRRQRQREMARGRMLAAVPRASVIITNPTHYAVALQYDEATMRAPRIIAMGKDHLALKIREVAAASKIPVLEAPPLARALYRHGDIDGEVPVELYSAVAQVLAWVYRLRTALRTPPLPDIEVPSGMDPLDAAP
jgi:flagellar biosynthetic protein FlhB